MEYKTVTIACPVRNREKYLPYYLDCILKQSYPKEVTNLFFVTNNCDDNSPKILKNFKKKYEKVYSNIRIDNLDYDKIPDDSNRLVRAKTNKIYEFLADLRNYICENT